MSILHPERMVFWNQETQRIKFTTRNDFEGIENYQLLGWSNEMEFEVYIDILFEKFGDQEITFGAALTTFQNFRRFLDKLKGLTIEPI